MVSPQELADRSFNSMTLVNFQSTGTAAQLGPDIPDDRVRKYWWMLINPQTSGDTLYVHSGDSTSPLRTRLMVIHLKKSFGAEPREISVDPDKPFLTIKPNTTTSGSTTGNQMNLTRQSAALNIQARCYDW